MTKYVIGMDFGTLSARGILINLESGEEIAGAEFSYPHGVLDSVMPWGEVLDDGFALQHPKDYLDALAAVTENLLKQSGIGAENVIGLGIDFTSCTMLPVKKDGTPLCFMEKFEKEPQSYAKLWKHHGASSEADLFTKVAEENGEKWLKSYGGKVSSEWLFPKIMETYNKAREVYDEADLFMEAGDWIVMMLTGNISCSSCMAGYKGMWNKKDGFPSKEFFGKLSEGFALVAEEKVTDNILPTGTKAGEVSKAGEKISGLKEGTTVAVPIIDAHASLPAAGITSGGKLMLIIGTSGCHIVMSDKSNDVPGICGRVDDGIIPGYTAYEAGQTCVGDGFGWFVENCVPASYEAEAKEKNMSTFALLTQKAEKLKVGESGLLALDWWNGNRTPYVDFELTGAIFGLTLKTKPEEIYRALIDAVAFGTKTIVDLYKNNGVEIESIYASGGISQKNKMLMQIYADVLGEEIIVNKSKQSGALGVAMFASVAGGYFKTLDEAATVLVSKEADVYKPNMENTKKYDKLYKEYVKLCEYFAESGNDVLKNLKMI